MHQRLEQTDMDFLGRLTDSQAEQAFQKAKQPFTRRRLRFICASTGLAYLAAAYADSFQMAGPALSLLVGARCLTALTGLVPLIFTFNKRTATSDLGKAAALYMSTMMACECLELFLKADLTTFRELPITVFIVLTFYLFQPPQIWQSIVSGGLGTIGYLCVLLFLTNAPPDHIVNTTLVFALANGFGLYFCVRFGAAQRREYVAMTKLRHQAETDALTGLLNRRRVQDLCKREFESARQNNHPCSLLLLDIDRFKTINDTAGHAAGDAVLVEFADRCSRILRMVDIFGRIGGEEFAVFMPHATGKQAGESAERIRKAIDDTPFQAEGKDLSVTVSIGVATLTAETDGLDALHRKADDALYAAKRCGRNRVHS